MEYIPVIVEGMGRRYPIETVKIAVHLPDGGALVVVQFPSYNIAGEITLETKAKLLAHRCLTGDKVAVKKTDSKLIKWLGEGKPFGPSEDWLERFRQDWDEIRSESVEDKQAREFREELQKL